MKDGNVKDALTECAESKMSFKPSPISIGHRGASMMVSAIYCTILLYQFNNYNH